MREMLARLLEKRTGSSVQAWNQRIRKANLNDANQLRAWLARQGVTGNPQTLLVMERFGYPEFYLASAKELIDGQYADRPHLRPIFDAILDAAREMGEVTVQARKTYVSLVSPLRTFARIQATTRNRVDIGFRIADLSPGGRLQPSKIHETMTIQVGLSHLDDFDSQVLDWLRRAYEENR